MYGAIDIHDPGAIMRRIRSQVAADDVLFGPHSIEAMEEEQPSFDKAHVYQALENGQVLENYPEAARGSCCLVYGNTEAGRPVHVVCTTAKQMLFVITVYEPRPPAFVTPTERG